MKLRSPAEYYLKYLLVHPERYSTEVVEQICDEYNVEYLNSAYLERLRLRCVPPDPFRPEDPLHVRSQRFLIKEKLLWLFRPTHDMKLAQTILENARAKEFAESMILSSAPDLAITRGLQKYRGVIVTPRAVELFRHYYWNIDLLDTTQFRTLLHYSAEMTGGDGGEMTRSDRAEKAAAKKASYLDPRRLAADLPHSPTTALMGMMRMGLMPSKVDLANTIRLGQQMAVLRSVEAVMQGSPQDALRALNFSQVAKNLTEMLEVVVDPDEDLQEKLSAVLLRTDNQPLPSIHQLSAGKFTVDVQPEAKDDEPIETIEGGEGDVDEPLL